MNADRNVESLVRKTALRFCPEETRHSLASAFWRAFNANEPEASRDLLVVVRGVRDTWLHARPLEGGEIALASAFSRLEARLQANASRPPRVTPTLRIVK